MKNTENLSYIFYTRLQLIATNKKYFSIFYHYFFHSETQLCASAYVVVSHLSVLKFCFETSFLVSNDALGLICILVIRHNMKVNIINILTLMNKKSYLVDGVKNLFRAANYFRAVNLRGLTVSSDS